jgi:hypothetical protein
MALSKKSVATILSYKEERNAKFLGNFWDLASNDDRTRIVGAANIVKFLKDNETNENFKPELEYTTKRLIKGLCSSRQSARQGFATCLCELLRLFATSPMTGSNNIGNIMSTSALLSIIAEETKVYI